MDIKDTFSGLSLFVSVATLLYTWRTASRRDFIATVTSERVKWRESLRQNVSKYTGKVHSYFHLRDDDKPIAQALLIEIDVLSYLIRFHLNPEEDPSNPDAAIQRLLSSIPATASKNTFDELQADLEKLTSLTQERLRIEWETIESEAKSGCLLKNRQDQLKKRASL